MDADADDLNDDDDDNDDAHLLAAMNGQSIQKSMHVPNAMETF